MSSARSPFEMPFPWPNSDRQLDFVEEISTATTMHKGYHDLSMDVPLVTAVHTHHLIPQSYLRKFLNTKANKDFVNSYNREFFNNYDPELHLQRYLDIEYRAKSPNTLFGSYVSGTQCTTAASQYYPESFISCSHFSEQAFKHELPEYFQNWRHHIDVTNPYAAGLLIV